MQIVQISIVEALVRVNLGRRKTNFAPTSPPTFPPIIQLQARALWDNKIAQTFHVFKERNAAIISLSLHVFAV